MNRNVSILALVLCAAGFAWGVAHILRLRFEGGDVYPAYSSLRADPLGTMAFYEALQRMPEMSVSRDFSANNHLPQGKGTTYLHLGAPSSEWQWIGDEEFRTVEDFVTSGGRLIVAFSPELTKSIRLFADVEEDEPERDRKKKSNAKEPPDKMPKKKKSGKQRRRNSLKERWGIEVGFRDVEMGTNQYRSTSAIKGADLRLPETLEWHSGVIFTNLTKAWRAIYSRGTNPVVVERKMGAGTVVLATDSYWVSNEAMLKDRQPELLVWCIGPSRQVVFDEAHFGIVEAEGVATLLRKYHLYGLVGGLAVLAALFIWKNSASFVPPWENLRSPNFVEGRDVSAGFINLLRRNVPQRDLLQVCFTEWKKSRGQKTANSSAREIEAERILTAAQPKAGSRNDPVATYREICRILKKI